MGYKKVVVIGGGVLGSQIAFQTAYKGFDVTMWLRSEASIGRTQPKIETLHKTYLAALEKMATPEGKSPFTFCRGLADLKTFKDEELDTYKEKVEKAYSGLKLELDMAEAVKDADLVIETMAEDPQAKIELYTKLADLLPENTVIVTNSSTMLPSTFAKYTGRPEKYLALHFANSIWKNNTAEIMGHAGTDADIYNSIVEFAVQIGMVPLQLHKEQPGYILNSMLVPFLSAAAALCANEVSDFATIDLTWKLGTGAPVGPFQIFDIVGLTTAYNIFSMSADAKNPDSTAAKIVAMLKERIDEGKLGVSTGEGFYNYKR